MTLNEASKRRMEEKVSDYRITHDQNRNPEVFSPWSFKEGYQTGMQDPDANKELLNECEEFAIDVERFKDNPWKLSQIVIVMIEKIREARK